MDSQSNQPWRNGERASGTKPAPGQDKAADFALARLAELSGRPDAPTPSLKVLARECGVAYMTMWKAASRLRRKGIIEMHRKTGIRLCSLPQEQPDRAQNTLSTAIPKNGQKWERTARRIVEDIHNSLYEHGESLGPIKHLAHRYGVCPPTLRRALEYLVDQGVLESSVGGYRTADAPRMDWSVSIVVLYRCDTPGSVRPITTTITRTLAELERICSRTNVHLQGVGWSYEENLLVPNNGWTPLALPPALSDSLLGFIVIGEGLHDICELGIFEEILRTRKPVAILDADGLSPAPDAARPWPAHLRIFERALDEKPGADMAAFMLQLGHRSVAYISGDHHDQWSRQRLEGIRRTFSHAGFSGGVRAAIAPSPPGYQGDVRRYFHEHSKTMIAALDNARISLKNATSSAMHWLGDTFADPAVFGAMTAFQERTELRERLTPLLDELCGCPEITAWIASNDETALVAFEFLRSRGISVPGKISVVGFDDSEIASHNGLTSYNFNEPALVKAMVRYLLDAPVDRRPSRTRQTPIERVSGFVTARNSTAPVRKS